MTRCTGPGRKPPLMLSIPDMALLGAAALLLFGPEQLPRVARKAGMFMREVQNTSQSFIREMERAADIPETPSHPSVYDPVLTERAAEAYDVAAPDPSADAIDAGEFLAEPRPALDREHAIADLLYPAEPAPQADHPTHI